MIEVRFAAPGGTLKALVEVMQEIVKEANMDFTPNGLSMQAMDSSHVCLLALHMPASSFTLFRCDDGDTTLGVSLHVLHKLLKSCSNEDIVTLHHSKEDVLTLFFESPDGTRISNFEMKLMNIDSEMLQVPDTHFPVEVSMSSVLFAKICKDLKELDDVLTISVNPKSGVSFEVDGSISKGCVCIRSGTDTATTIRVDSTSCVRAVYSLRYLNMFARAASLTQTVSFKMSSELPLVTTYEMENMGNVAFFLAPKLSTDE